MSLQDKKPDGVEKPKGNVIKLPQRHPLIDDPKAQELAKLLTYCRPHGSKTERHFINDYLMPLGVKFDTKGNAFKRIGDAPVMWSCHTDTVHHRKGKQVVEFWTGADSEMLFGVKFGEASGCLGADDTAGIFIMMEMIRDKVPGLYVFHRGEECGSIGSHWIADHNKKFVEGIKFCIAFDRKDIKSIITFQRGDRTCSDEFAKSLAEQIGMGHECDDGGVWTDSASYTDLIPECTNISVGYYDAHSSRESLNVSYLMRLRDAMVKLDTSKLVEKRKAGDKESKPKTRVYYDDGYTWGRSYSYSHTGHTRPAGGHTSVELDNKYGFNEWMKYFGYDSKTGWWLPFTNMKLPQPVKETKSEKKGKGNSGSDLYEIRRMIRDNPEIICDMLDQSGWTAEKLGDHILQCGGTVTPPFYGM